MRNLHLNNFVYFIFLLLRFCSGYTDYYGDGYFGDMSLSSDWDVLGDQVHQPKCVAIPERLTLCRNIGYKEMRLPNLLDHESLNEVLDQAKVWVPLINLHCHPDTKLFLCSLYSPVCLEKPIYPCKSLCEGVKRGCEERINNYGYPWPEILRCDKFPEDSDLCIGQVNGLEEDQAANVCIPCKQPMTYESLLDSYCWATFVVKVKVKKITNDRNGDKKIVLRGGKQFYKTIPQSDVKTFEPVINGGAACECDGGPSKKGRMLVMGTKQGDRYVVTYISTMSSEKEFKRAMKAIMKKHDCKEEIGKIAGQTEGNNGGLSTSGEPLPPIDEQFENISGETNKRKDRKKKKKKKKDKNKKKDKQKLVGIGCLPCLEQPTYDNIMARFCEADFVAKTRKINQVKIDQNGDKRLILRKTKKGSFYRKQNLSKRDLRRFQPVISGGSNCDCPIASPGSRNLLVMGKKQGGRFVLTYLGKWSKEKDFKKASRALRKGFTCGAGNTNNASNSG